MSENINYNIVILPEETLASRSMEASRQITAVEPTVFELDNKNFFVHATLYMVRIKQQQLAEAKQRLAELAAQTTPLDMVASHYNQARGFISVSYERSPAINNLQQQVIRAINPLRTGMPPEQTELVKSAEGLQLQKLENYGFDRVGEAYNPHITLSRTASQQPINAEATLADMATFNGVFSELGMFELGDNGTCVREVARFAFAE
jgi:2'-5' RNA ligase